MRVTARDAEAAIAKFCSPAVCSCGGGLRTRQVTAGEKGPRASGIYSRCCTNKARGCAERCRSGNLLSAHVMGS